MLILPEKEFNDKLVLESGKELYLEVSFETAKHTSVIGTVVEMPDKLIYGHGRLDMKWKCWMELEKGDMVWMNWDAIITAMRSAEQKIKIGGKLHLLIPYSQLFLALRIIPNAKEIYPIWKNVDKFTKYKTNILTRDKTTYDVVMLNGYCLVEPVRMKNLPPHLLPSGLFIAGNINLPDIVKDAFSDSYGMVVYCGVPNKEYVEKYMDDKAKVKPGDIIRFEKSADIFLEYPLHAKLTDDKALFYRIQRHLMTVRMT